MAKWGEGDPRWIVEERPDAVNVNNWHWTEKNATPWSKERLRSLLGAFRVQRDSTECWVKTVKSIDGEATANNRKGKLFFFYEWTVALKWEGRTGPDGTPYGGDINIPDLSEENELDEVHINVTSDEKTQNDEARRLHLFMYDVGREQLRQVLAEYLKQLRDEFSRGLILPTKAAAAGPTVRPDAVANITSGFSKQTELSKKPLPTAAAAATGQAGVPVTVRTINMDETFQCRAADLYEVLTDVQAVATFTSGPCVVEANAGGRFEMFGGNINGKFVELEANKRIVQTWRCNQWQDGHFSRVTITLTEMSDHTQLKMTQTGVPEIEVEATTRNWKLYYWNSIKQVFGFGSFI